MGSEKIYKVFVSSTYEDLREERAAVEKGLLQIDCWPVGMELFPAADEETWDFIKSQIDDSDYYVVVIAGRYGSQAPDGISFTEMEYDYAIERGKPAIGFVHGDPGSIAANKTETSEEARVKLQKFIKKIKKRPVRLFKNPDDLALQVTTSFNWLKRNRPAVGYVRTDASVDFKKYSEVLEENNRLKEALSASQSFAPFPAHEKSIQLTIAFVFDDNAISNVIDKSPRPLQTIDCSLMQGFRAVAEGALLYERQTAVLSYAARLLYGAAEAERILEGPEDTTLGFDEASVRTPRRELVLYGLIEVAWEDRTHVEDSHLSRYIVDHSSSITRTVTIWKLTDYGRRQLAAIAS